MITKGELGLTDLEYNGNIIINGAVKPFSCKIEAVNKWAMLNNKKCKSTQYSLITMDL